MPHSHTYTREDDITKVVSGVIVTGGDPVDDNDLARKKYVDDHSGGGGALSPLITVNSINAKTVAVTPLYTVPAGKKLILTNVSIRTTAFTLGSKSIDAAGNIGKTSLGNTDYYDSANLEVQKFTAVDQLFYIIPINATENSGVPVPVYNAGDIVNLSIATGSDATLETWSVDLIGYLI